MAIPILGAAAMAAGRAVAKKLATRAVGGITGTGAKSVGSVYREQGFSNTVLSRPGYTPKNSLGSNSVKVKPAQSTDPTINQSLAKMQQKYANSKVADRKSGGEAYFRSQQSYGADKAIQKSTGKKTPVIKIKSK